MTTTELFWLSVLAGVDLYASVLVQIACMEEDSTGFKFYSGVAYALANWFSSFSFAHVVWRLWRERSPPLAFVMYTATLYGIKTCINTLYLP